MYVRPVNERIPPSCYANMKVKSVERALTVGHQNKGRPFRLSTKKEISLF